MKKIFFIIIVLYAFNLYAGPKILYDTAYVVTSTSATEEYGIFGMFDGNIRLVDAKTSEIILLNMAHKKPVVSINVSADGKYMVTAGQDDTIIFWDMVALKEIKRIVKQGMGIRGVVLNNDGSKLYIAYPSQIFEYDTKSWVNTGLYDGYENGIYSIALNYEGTLLATGSKNGEISILDLKKGEITSTYNAGRELIISLDYAYSDNTLIAGSYDKSVRVYKDGKTRPVKEFSLFKDTVRGVKINSKGTMALAGSDDGNVILYDLVNNKFSELELNKKGEITSISAPKSFNFILVGKGTAFEEEHYGIILYPAKKMIFRKLYSFQTSDIIISENDKIEGRGSFGEYIRVYHNGNIENLSEYMGIEKVNF